MTTPTHCPTCGAPRPGQTDLRDTGITYQNSAELLLNAGGGKAKPGTVVRVGPDTLVAFPKNGTGSTPGAIVVSLGGLVVADLHDAYVDLWVTTALLTHRAQNRVNRILAPLGYRMVKRAGKFYVVNTVTREVNEYIGPRTFYPATGA